MRQTDQTLLEQMRITELDVASRMELLSFTQEDVKLLKGFRSTMESKVDSLVDRFYQIQTGIEEIALVIGDADTLFRLRTAQRRYLLDLFSGLYDLEYVNNRLRIGLVHKRIGVEPKLYLSAISTLKSLLTDVIQELRAENNEYRAILGALDKLFMFDITLVFETYIRSLVAEIEISKEKSERYASALEEKVKQRTEELEILARIDSLTGLHNVRHLHEVLTRTLRSAQRRSEPVSVVYIDINDFKMINDSHGHSRGDEVLRAVSNAIKTVSRMEDSCFRYGGDEFCVILPNCTEEQARERHLYRLQEVLNDQLIGITLSIGIAQAGPIEYEEADALIHLADDRMYAHKKAIKASRDIQDN